MLNLELGVESVLFSVLTAGVVNSTLDVFGPALLGDGVGPELGGLDGCLDGLDRVFPNFCDVGLGLLLNLDTAVVTFLANLHQGSIVLLSVLPGGNKSLVAQVSNGGLIELFNPVVNFCGNLSWEFSNRVLLDGNLVVLNLSIGNTCQSKRSKEHLHVS